MGRCNAVRVGSRYMILHAVGASPDFFFLSLAHCLHVRVWMRDGTCVGMSGECNRLSVYVLYCILHTYTSAQGGVLGCVCLGRAEISGWPEMG